MSKTNEKPRLLIADDEAANISALVSALRDENSIIIARNGIEALERGNAMLPDLFLLDIKMPGLDGYEVCRRIRANPALKTVPVIFITALDAEQDESLGFSVGANDYITKPFSPAIVRARIKTQIELKRHRDHLEALAEERARQLLHAERLATLGTLAAGVAHEINNALTSVSAFSEMLVRIQRKIAVEERDRLEHQLGAGNPVITFIDTCGKYAAAIVDACDRITRIVSSMQSYSKRGADKPQPTVLADCVKNAIQLCVNNLKYGIDVRVDVPGDLPRVLAQPQQIEQVLINLINNAAQAINEIGKTGVINIAGRHADDHVVLTIEDSGPGIPPGKLDTIWEAFYTSKGDKGTGLGLSISHGIITEHHGRITAENRTEGGARFNITLPANI